MMKRVRIHSLKFKIIFAFIMISTCLILLQVGVLQRWIDRLIMSQSESYFQETVRQIGKRVDIQYQQLDTNVRIIRDDQVIKNYLMDLKHNRINYQIAKYRITRQIVNLPNLDMIDNIYIFPAAAGKLPMNIFYTKAVYQADDQIVQLMNVGRNMPVYQTIWTVRTHPDQSSMMMFIYEGTEMLGLLRVDLNEKFNNQLDDVNLGEGGEVYLINQQKIMFAMDRKLINQEEAALDQVSGSRMRVTYLLHYQDWKLIGSIPEAEMLQQVNQANSIMLLMELLVFASIFIFAMVTLRLILKPLKKIMKGMDSIQKGKLNVIVEDSGNGKDEFSVIIHHFNYMVERVDSLIKTIYYQQLNYRKAEMINLQSKLNPHFLYNTLDMIYWMSVMKDEEEIGDAILSLSNILRYSISHSNEFVTVTEDMEQLENYLKIQKRRFDGKLQYMFDVEENIADIKIPKLLIQPLVENSIKYAFRNMLLVGTISIRGYAAEDEIYFEVEDNGVGMTEEQVQSLVSSFENRTGAGGIGIPLVHQRIKYIYGEDCGLSIVSAVGKGMKITAKLRKNPDFDQDEYWRSAAQLA